MTKKSSKQTKLTRESGMFKKEGLSLGGRVRDLRNEKGWTLEEAGLRMNMDPKHLWKLEHAYDGLNVTLVTLVRIADAFDIPVQSLFAYRGEVREPIPRKKKVNLARKNIPFTYHDSPKAKEQNSCLPLYNLKQSPLNYDPLSIHQETWAKFDPFDQNYQDVTMDTHCVISLNEKLSKHLGGKIFAILERFNQWQSHECALVYHPSLKNAEHGYQFQKISFNAEAKSVTLTNQTNDYLTLSLDECAALKVLGYLHTAL